jgi:hypothetical protein
MRRPNRSIEVLDISLMAVVTKAMGAFLVLMVVFMQYYQSGPIGQNTAEQLSQAIEQTQKNTTDALRRLIEKANPEDIAKLLEEARRRLEEAKNLIEQLRRENAALNAQAQRLQQENDALEKEIAELEKRLAADKFVITGTLLNWDCIDTRFQLGLITTQMFLTLPNNRREKYVLNSSAALGSSASVSEPEYRRVRPNSPDAPGTGTRFNMSTFRYATDPIAMGLIVVKQNPTPQKIGEYEGFALKRTNQDCSVLVSLQAALPGKDLFRPNFTIRLVIPKDSYAEALYDIRLNPENGTLTTLDPSAPTLAWLKDQIANAVKVSQ